MCVTTLSTPSMDLLSEEFSVGLTRRACVDEKAAGGGPYGSSSRRRDTAAVATAVSPVIHLGPWPRSASEICATTAVM
jgi:hypothetical protein